MMTRREFLKLTSAVSLLPFVPKSWMKQKQTLPLKSAYALYTPRGATSFEDSLLDRSGNGNHAILPDNVKWTSEGGWTFDGYSHITTVEIYDRKLSDGEILDIVGKMANEA